MKDNQFVKIILYVLIVVFIFLLLRNNKSLEGYIDDLTVGKWKLSGDSSTFNVSSSEDGKTVSFGAPVKVQDLTIMKATEDKGLMRKDEPVLIIPSTGLFIGTADGKGIRVDKDGNLSANGAISGISLHTPQLNIGSKDGSWPYFQTTAPINRSEFKFIKDTSNGITLNIGNDHHDFKFTA